MHYIKCPKCPTGSKCIAFNAGWDGTTSGFILGKYSSCSCRLTEAEKFRILAAAKKEAAVV